jgi:cytochrome d ubiquinol oxidase subunit II
MFSFESFVDLPLIWYSLIATAIFLYVLLDGFDLGVGVLFPFAPTDRCRDRMMNSIAPFWDGNETWLVLGGGGLLAAFPLVPIGICRPDAGALHTDNHHVAGAYLPRGGV